jgi:hypothetical protein
MLVMREQKIQHAHMPLVTKKEQLNLAILKMMTNQVQECIKNIIPMMAKPSLYLVNNKKNIIRTQGQEPMMLAMKELRIQHVHMLLVTKKEQPSLEMHKMMTSQAQACTKK